MTNISHLPAPDARRQARADFVKNAIELEERSVRYVAIRAGISPASLGDRLKGRIAFTADDLEGIAHVLKRDPVEFYRDYISVGLDGLEPPTISVKSRELADVIPFPARAS